MTIETGRQGRRTYPNIPESNWWALRRRFQQTMPREVDASYLATVLDISEAAAGNVTGPLRAVGLIDENGRPTDVALAWRDDEQYRQVTIAMLESVYPQGLRDAAPPRTPTEARWSAGFPERREPVSQPPSGWLASISCWQRAIRRLPSRLPPPSVLLGKGRRQHSRVWHASHEGRSESMSTRSRRVVAL